MSDWGSDDWENSNKTSSNKKLIELSSKKISELTRNNN